MNIKKPLIAIGATTALGMALVAGGALAQGARGGDLVDKISTRFNLNKADVQKVFDENRVEKRTQMEQRYEERLNQAVKDGKLTAEQKDKILAKHKELMSQMEAKKGEIKELKAGLEGKSAEERKQLLEQHRSEMEKHHDEIEAWEKENNIPSGYLGLKMAKGFHHKPGRPLH